MSLYVTVGIAEKGINRQVIPYYLLAHSPEEARNRVLALLAASYPDYQYRVPLTDPVPKEHLDLIFRQLEYLR